MTATISQNWFEANDRALTLEVTWLRARLTGEEGLDHLESERRELWRSMETPPAFVSFAKAFGLTAFEQAVLLLAAAPEFDAGFNDLCAQVQNDPLKNYPTFNLAMTVLSEPHWGAIMPGSALRLWRLLEVNGPTLTSGALRIDERVLHALVGLNGLDAHLAAMVEPVTSVTTLTRAHVTIVDQLEHVWQGNAAPLVQLCSEPNEVSKAIAVQTTQRLGLQLWRIAPLSVPTTTVELEQFIRLWEREVLLSRAALMLETNTDLDPHAIRLLERSRFPFVLVARERQRCNRTVLHLEVPALEPREQHAIWRDVIADRPDLAHNVGRLVAQFNLSPDAIQTIGLQALNSPDPAQAMWYGCRTHARARLNDLAQRIDTDATWDDLVLPEREQRTLREISMQVRQRHQVYENWGFGRKGARGLGITTLFAGPSGTGKTLAAEALANELELDLYKIDLSQVVNKYIGETEKNLRRVFDAAEASGAVLLFDEADSLFGKRSEVKDSHDRYANLEVSYLLQRMEAYRGLAILTSNLKDSIDQAFLRRLRFVVSFPHPGPVERAEIWRRIFPSETPTDGLEHSKLARLNITGGNIRNIAMHAAFLAADAEEPVRMVHLRRAAQVEYAKLERPLSESEIGNWL
jgi:AAA+ superfamily predicted ATPase